MQPGALLSCSRWVWGLGGGGEGWDMDKEGPEKRPLPKGV